MKAELRAGPTSFATEVDNAADLRRALAVVRVGGKVLLEVDEQLLATIERGEAARPTGTVQVTAPGVPA